MMMQGFKLRSYVCQNSANVQFVFMYFIVLYIVPQEGKKGLKSEVYRYLQLPKEKKKTKDRQMERWIGEGWIKAIQKNIRI